MPTFRYILIFVIAGTLADASQADMRARAVGADLAITQRTVPDPVEGRWSGQVGFPEDRIAVAFEFTRVADSPNTVRIFLYNPVSNLFGVDMGTLSRNGDRYEATGMPLSFELRQGVIEGTMTPLSAPLVLHRSTSLPHEVPVSHVPTGPGPIWRTKLGAAIYAPVAAHDGVAYVGTVGGEFYAVNLSNGSFLWSFAAGKPVYGEALLTDASVLFVCDNGFLYKLDRRSGQQEWRVDLGDAASSRMLPHSVDSVVPRSGSFDWDRTAPKPLLVDGVLYVGAGDGSVHAVELATGAQKWRTETPAKIRTDAVSAGDYLCVGNFDGQIFGLSRSTGRVVWSRPAAGAISGSAALIDGHLVIGTRGGVLLSLDPTTGAVRWRRPFWGSAVESSPVDAGHGALAIGSSDMRKISLIDSADGRVIWRTDIFGWAWARPAVTATRIYAAAAGASPYSIRQLGSLSALDRETGRLLWRWPMPEWPGAMLNGFVSAPAVDAGVVVVGGLDGTLYGFSDRSLPRALRTSRPSVRSADFARPKPPPRRPTTILVAIAEGRRRRA